MGYTTEFSGQIDVVPPLDKDEIAFLKKFNQSRRMDREKGPYFVDGTDSYGQGRDADIRNYNEPPEGQPGLWCQWVPTECGCAIEWDGGEKFYDSAEWMKYIVEHFLKPGALAIGKVPAIKGGHVLNGEIMAQGEDSDDRWKLIVKDNVVMTARRSEEVFEEPQPV
jgi:hypothetical protein